MRGHGAYLLIIFVFLMLILYTIKTLSIEKGSYSLTLTPLLNKVSYTPRELVYCNGNVVKVKAEPICYSNVCDWTYVEIFNKVKNALDGENLTAENIEKSIKPTLESTGLSCSVVINNGSINGCNSVKWFNATCTHGVIIKEDGIEEAKVNVFGGVD